MILTNTTQPEKEEDLAELQVICDPNSGVCNLEKLQGRLWDPCCGWPSHWLFGSSQKKSCLKCYNSFRETCDLKSQGKFNLTQVKFNLNLKIWTVTKNMKIVRWSKHKRLHFKTGARRSRQGRKGWKEPLSPCQNYQLFFLYLLGTRAGQHSPKWGGHTWVWTKCQVELQCFSVQKNPMELFHPREFFKCILTSLIS